MPRGGGKFSKPTRGGGKKFSRDVRPAEDAPGMWDDGPREKEEESEEESEEEESEEESDDNAGPSASSSKPKLPAVTGEMSRDERRAAQKALKEAKRAQLTKGVASMSLSDDEEEEEEAAPAPQKAPKGLPSGNPNAGNVEPTISRREREAAEAAAAKERYRKLHEAGKTEEAKSDLARLALIKKEREEKAKQRAAELEEKKRQAEIKAKNSGKKMR
ncbi:hypothetical protein TWF481_003990 [Arthrobotrys musiformis]|uniref:Casein kinase substrate phosphoprotein PP28 domain-containing protein n=1 Tax=Arthrobotrys musiformis TaxID=47236 RepID=A0AAV9WI78_9PEZI